jgi:hypothetical protein
MVLGMKGKDIEMNIYESPLYMRRTPKVFYAIRQAAKDGEDLGKQYGKLRGISHVNRNDGVNTIRFSSASYEPRPEAHGRFI